MSAVSRALRVRRHAVAALRLTVKSGGDMIQLPWFTKANLAAMPTVVVSADFTRYVSAMAAQWPEGERVVWPTIDDARWPFPDRGVLLVWEEPYENEIWVTSDDERGVHERGVYDDVIATHLNVHRPGQMLLVHGGTPYSFHTRTIATFVLDPTHTRQPTGKLPDGTFVDMPPGFLFSYTMHLHEDLSTTSGYWIWNGGKTRHEEEERISRDTRFDRSLVEAVGNRLSVLADPPQGSMTGPERRALQRERIGEYRLLSLRTPVRASERSDGTTGNVEWTKRWVVRGHWRSQACGEGWRERRNKWIDPFIKGPADMPLDVRPEVFTLDK